MIPCPAEILDELEKFAARRGVTAQALAATLLTLIVDDDLVEAILDDGTRPLRDATEREAAEKERARLHAEKALAETYKDLPR